MMDFDTLDEFTKAYIVCSLWSSNDESTPQGGEPMDRHYGPEHFAPETLQRMANDCECFQKHNAALLEEAYKGPYEPSSAGHDFWLTRNGHGAGFWDRDAVSRELGQRLTEACRTWPEVNLYIGDDGKIYA